jgi:two-component system cell cycle sensor histidine kinase/response regulator CckA
VTVALSIAIVVLLGLCGALAARVGHERRRAERLRQEVRAAEAQAQETRRLEAIGQLAGGIAHDFNNVLQAVKGYTELAVESLPRDHPALPQLKQVSDAADRAALFTAQLLTFSRRDALPQSAPLDLTQLATQTGSLLRRSLSHIPVVVEHHDRPMIDGDRGQIEHVLMNLCINARDAMPDGGVITIATGRTAFTADDCRTRPWAREGQWAYLSVRDEGMGIPDEVRPRIFEPFFTTKPAGRGTGLGLSTVYAIAERHGGFVSVDTKVGAGSTFTAYFPDRGVAPAPKEQAATAARAPEGETILLAEDEPLVRELAVEMLESAGYRVLVACDGSEAESIIQTRGGEIRAAVLDVVMPGRNGRQVFETLQRVRPDVAAVFCSGYAFGELGDVDKHAGTIVLAKPYSRAALLAAVRRASEIGRRIPTE